SRPAAGRPRTLGSRREAANVLAARPSRRLTMPGHPRSTLAFLSHRSAPDLLQPWSGAGPTHTRKEQRHAAHHEPSDRTLAGARRSDNAEGPAPPLRRGGRAREAEVLVRRGRGGGSAVRSGRAGPGLPVVPRHPQRADAGALPRAIAGAPG